MTPMQTTVESVAKILIIDSQYRALTLTVGKHLTRPEKSHTPDLPGGIVDPGESEQDAVIREVKEECGIDLNPHSLRLAYAMTKYYEKENKSVTKLLYIIRVDEAPPVTLSWEHSHYTWIPVHELRVIEFRPFFSHAIKYSIENNLV